MTWPGLILLGLLTATPPPLQNGVPANCSDDRGIDRCAAAQQARVRARFGVETIEAHRDAGDQVRRVFYVDGYGRDVVAIAFVRRPGHDPEVRIHLRREEGSRALPPMVAPVPSEVWNRLIERGDLFDRALAPMPEPADPNVVRICIHSWVYTAEGTDPAAPDGEPATLRRRTEDGCSNGTTGAFAAEVYWAALPLFPHCALLNPAHYRNPASQLAACGILGGDRQTAAYVRNAAEPLFDGMAVEDMSGVARLFDYRAQVDWNGDHYAGREPDGAARFFLSKIAGAGGGSFVIDSVEGLDGRRARLRGNFARMPSQPQEIGESVPVREIAPVEVMWEQDYGDRFLIRTVTVGPWQAVR